MLIGISILTFVIIHLAPGSPIDMLTSMNQNVDSAARAKLTALYGLDKPISLQYLDWHMKNAGAQRELFSPAARKAIYRQAQGTPRMMNRLAWESLNQGCLDGAEVITEELFAYVCKNLGPHLGN